MGSSTQLRALSPRPLGCGGIRCSRFGSCTMALTLAPGAGLPSARHTPELSPGRTSVRRMATGFSSATAALPAYECRARSTTQRAIWSVLVSGSAGFIGGYVVEELLTRGYEVVGVDNFSKYGRVEKSYDSNLRYTLVEGDTHDEG